MYNLIVIKNSCGRRKFYRLYKGEPETLRDIIVDYLSDSDQVYWDEGTGSYYNVSNNELAYKLDDDYASCGEIEFIVADDAELPYYSRQLGVDLFTVDAEEV